MTLAILFFFFPEIILLCYSVRRATLKTFQLGKSLSTKQTKNFNFTEFHINFPLLVSSTALLASVFVLYISKVLAS